MPVDLDAAAIERLVFESEDLSGGDLLNVVITAASAAIEREGPGCSVAEGDFSAAVEAVLRAKREIGPTLELKVRVEAHLEPIRKLRWRFQGWVRLRRTHP